MFAIMEWVSVTSVTNKYQLPDTKIRYFIGVTKFWCKF